MLDVGCGWGSFAIHAATRHGVNAVGITLSEHQAQLARERAREAGVADRVEFRVADYREVVGRPVRRDRQHRHGRARGRRSRSTCTPGACASLLRPGRPAAQPRDREAQGLRHAGRGRVLRAVRVSGRGAAAALADPARARAGRAGDHPRRGPAERLRQDDRPSGSSASTRARTRRCGSPGSSARASGACTCARRGRASRPAGRRSTRCSLTAESRTSSQRINRTISAARTRRTSHRYIRWSIVAA